MQVAKTSRELNGIDVSASFLFECSKFESLEDATKAVESSELNEFCWLLLVSIAITRRDNDWLKKLAEKLTEPQNSVSKDQLLDALFVSFMFNLINEVANRCSLRPEWHMVKWSGMFRRKALQTALLTFVKMKPVSPENGIACPYNLAESLLQLGLHSSDFPKTRNGVWKCFDENPRMAVSIQQILFALALICKEGKSFKQRDKFPDVLHKAVSAAVDKLNAPEVDSILGVVAQQSA